MKHVFRNKRISGVLTVLPQKEFYFDEEAGNYTFPVSQSMRLKKIMGYEKHRMVKPGTTVSDLCVFGLEHLFRQGLLKKEEIDALILVTQSPDYFMPPTSNVIQGKLGLKTDMLCMDINQGCCGYLTGLMQAFLLLEMEQVHKVAVLNGDVLSGKVCRQDRNSFPLVGDAASVTIVENSREETEIPFSLYMDGQRNELLMIPAGGFRMPSDGKTAEIADSGDGNLRSLDHLVMDGSEVFNFVMREVPDLIKEILEDAGLTDADIDCYLFHQPNKFMLEKLAERIGIDKSKVPMNVVTEYGNSSGCTIPVNMVHNLGEQLKTRTYRCCLSGFGSGLSWGAMVMKLGNFDFAESIISPY